MRKRLAYTAGLTLAAAALAPAAAQAGNTDVTIDQYNGSSFIGEVKSSKGSCVNNRKVKLFKKGSSKDQKIGSDKSAPGKGDSEGVWIITLEGAPPGDYYAKVKAKDNCDKDKSQTFSLGT